MNRDDIIRMAREAFGTEHELFWMAHTDENLERFAAFVSAEWKEKCNTYMELHDAVVKDSDRLYALNAELVEALQALFDDYKRLADSGDAGNWSLEDLPVGQQALAALRKAQGDNNGQR